MSAYIIRLKQTAFFLHHINGFRMIFHIKPVTDIFAVSVYRKLLSMQGIVNDERNQLFRELIRSVIIGTVGNIRRELVRFHICLYKHVRRSFAGRIRTAGTVGCRLIKIAAILLQGTIYLVCGNMQELFTLLICSVSIFPCRLCTVQHDSRSKYVGLNKNFRIFNASVHMALCREMHYPIDIILRKNFGDGLLITYVRLHKCIVFPSLYFFQIFQISCIGQTVHIDNTNFIAIFPKHVMNIIGTDKTGSSRYQIRSHHFPPVRIKRNISYPKTIYSGFPEQEFLNFRTRAEYSALTPFFPKQSGQIRINLSI